MSEDEYRATNPEKLRIYDIGLDAFRDAIQKDIDDYMSLMRAYGKVREVSCLAHEELMASVNPVRRA